MNLQVSDKFIGYASHKCLKQFHKALGIATLQVLNELTYNGCIVYLPRIGVVRQQEVHESLLHLIIRVIQGVCLETFVIALYGQISALVEHGNGVVHLYLHAVQFAGTCLVAREFLGVKVKLLHQLHQVGGCARAEPVAAVLLLAQSPKDAEGVIHAWSVRAEMITVIALAQGFVGLILGLAVCGGQFPYLVVKRIVQLTLRYAAYIIVVRTHGNVHQVVKVAEHADLTELAHARQQGKAYVGISTLQHAIESL